MMTWLVIRLVLAGLSFGVALLAVLPSPTLPLFRLSIGATEFGHWLILLPLVLLAAGPWRGLPAMAAAVLSLAACVLFLSSAVRAQRYAVTLPGVLASAFPLSVPAESADARPFAWSRLWFARAGAPVKTEVHRFAGHDGTQQAFHFYRSQTRPPAPCVVVVHGGSWESGSPEDFAASHRLLAQQGYAVAAITYRFAPHATWPAQRDDVFAALRSLKERADGLGIDPQKFVIMGRSAGGQIAEAAAYSAHDPAIRGCIAFYAPADMHFAHEFAREDDIISSLGVVLRYMGGPPSAANAAYDSASAIRLADSGSPPTLLFHGQRDPLVWHLQSQRLAARLHALGVPHCYIDLPWASHGFDYNPTGPGGQIASYAIRHFLESVTR